MHSKGFVTAVRLKYGPGLKSIVYVHGWNQVAFACNQDKEFLSSTSRKVTVVVPNEDSTAVSKALIV